MLQSPGLVLDMNGYFSLAGKRFVPVGVNYWPASCGVEMWQQWPADEIQHDLDVIRSLELNCVRFFLRWQDFEPEASQYDQVMFDRLTQFLTWCDRRSLFAQPSLFVGWMSGGMFWPHWRGDRNVFADPFMVERAAAFAKRAAAVIAPFHAGLLGIDQGNELCCLPDNMTAPPSAAINWCRTVNEAIRSEYPRCLIVSGNDHSQTIADTGWQLGNQPGTNYYSMHTYPVPMWHPIGFDGMTDPLCQSLLPFYTKVARAFGAVMVQEFGTILTFDKEIQDNYLRAVLPASWEAGANGFLWWCLRDITAKIHPYIKNAFEGTLGLVDAQDQVKPGLEYYIEFAKSLANRPAPRPPSNAIGIYFPKYYYLRENQENPGNDPRQMSRHLIIANYLLQQLGHAVRIVRGDMPIDPGVRTILIPSVLVASDEARALETWVRAGGQLIWHGPDPMSWGYDYIRLLGAKPINYRCADVANTNIFGDTWLFIHFPRNARLEVAPAGATVLARDENESPLLLRNSLGEGTVIYTMPFVEESVAAIAHKPTDRDRWVKWYSGVLEMCSGKSAIG
jgi:hypothetical protein